MTDSPTKLICPFDFNAQGKHCDFIRLPHSVHRSAYGWLPLPVICINNGVGPTVLVMSGTHGDEYEGQVAISRLAQAIQMEDVSGRLILFPMANFPAAKQGLRTSPIDDLNLNLAVTKLKVTCFLVALCPLGIAHTCFYHFRN